VVSRFRGLLGPDTAAARQALSALTLGLLASLAAGLTLGGIHETLEDLPGLLVLVPAAIGMRGTIFGALGARLGTSIHTGTFTLSRRRDNVLGQNVAVAGVATMVASVALAVLAKAVAVGFGFADTIPVAEMIVISVLGGLLSSVVVLVITVSLAARSVHREWDLDNVMAPLVNAAGDLVTLPALWLATLVVGVPGVTPVVAVVAVVGSVVLLTKELRSSRAEEIRMLHESLPVVIGAGILSLLAGVSLEGQLTNLVEYPALLALVPPFLASAGALGGILSSRLSSKLHLGTVEPAAVPGRSAREDIVLVFVLGPVVFALGSLVADVAALLIDLPSPGPLDMVVIALAGGFFATVASASVAYYGAIVSYRLGIDPDNVGIPLVTSSIDLIGSICFIVAVVTVVT
jgi:mgtE-like transporter